MLSYGALCYRSQNVVRLACPSPVMEGLNSEGEPLTPDDRAMKAPETVNWLALAQPGSAASVAQRKLFL
jgi:hypothetical protein